MGRVIAGEPVKISNCSYHGDLKCSASEANNFAGGMVSTVQSNTEIRDSRYGGTVLGASITENTVSAKAVGNGTPAVLEGITLWNGI